MRERWAEAFAERAASYWTADRLRALAGDRNVPLMPDRAAVLLRALGLLNGDASMPPDRVRKWRQINHMVVVLGPTLRALSASDGVVRIIDAGCGRSYLTMALAWTLRHRDHRHVRLLGLDRDPVVIDASRRRAEAAGLAESTRYAVADLLQTRASDAWMQAWGEPGAIDLVVALHACDVATDAAIALGVRAGATSLALAPCCQAELAAKWERLATSSEASAFSAVHASPHLRRHAAATITDTMRMLLLRANGYEASAIEFVASEHTPKNTLIRATRGVGPAERADARRQYDELVRTTGGETIALEAALVPDA